MSELPKVNEHAFTHMLTVFSVSAGMVGVCLTAIGLVKIVSNAKGIETLFDDLIAIDSILFGIAALLGFRGLQRFVGHQLPLSPKLMDRVFQVALGLMIVICGVITWSML
jgi:hypothetical protein